MRPRLRDQMHVSPPLSGSVFHGYVIVGKYRLVSGASTPPTKPRRSSVGFRWRNAVPRRLRISRLRPRTTRCLQSPDVQAEPSAASLARASAAPESPANVHLIANASPIRLFLFFIAPQRRIAAPQPRPTLITIARLVPRGAEAARHLPPVKNRCDPQDYLRGVRCRRARR